MSRCNYRECPSDCGESDCNCPCHQDALEDAKSEHNDDWNSKEMEELCPYDECRKDCYGYSDDCNCPCHQDALESQCCAEWEAEAMAAELAALEGNSGEEGSSSDEQSK